jgi:hypothetical protein
MLSRGAVAKILSASPMFQVVSKDGHKLIYGVAERNPNDEAKPPSIKLDV